MVSESHIATLLCLQNGMTFWVDCAANQYPNCETINLINSASPIKEEINRLMENYEQCIDADVKKFGYS